MSGTYFKEFPSTKSRSVFTVTGTDERSYLAVSGEAAANRKVQDEVVRIRRSGATRAEAVWTAKMLANTY